MSEGSVAAMDFDAEELNAELAAVVDSVELPGVMSDSEADAIWVQIFRALHINDVQEQNRFKRAAAVHFLLSSTSTAGDFGQNITTVDGRTYPLSAFLNLSVLPINLLRRFWRSSRNINIMMMVSHVNVVKSKLVQIAHRRGIDTNVPRAVSDVLEFFTDATRAELAEVRRIRNRKLSRNETLETASTPDSNQLPGGEGGGPPPPSSSYNS